MSSRLKTFKSRRCDYLAAHETAGILEQAFELDNDLLTNDCSQGYTEQLEDAVSMEPHEEDQKDMRHD